MKLFKRFFNSDNKVIFGISLFFFLVVILITVSELKKIQDTRQRAAGSGLFQVSGNKIIDPNGNQFIVKGATPIYGPFAGGDDTGNWSTFSLNNATNIFQDIKTNWGGVNLVRIFTSAAGANGVGPADWNLPNYRNLLWDTVARARAEGFVVLLVNSYSDIPNTRSWIKELALRYKDDPYIWITPSNEPFCTSPNTAESNNCVGGSTEWTYWRTNMNNFISDIRSQGFKNPILINSIQWSWDLSQIGTYTLTDPLNNLIYGAHRYANDNTTFTTAEQNEVNNSWANLSTTYPIVADEIGNCNGGLTHFTWLQGMVDFVANWTNTRQGSGMIGFNHYWSDCNSQTNDGITPNAWGNYYINNFLKKVNGGIVISITTPNPSTTITPVPTATTTPTPGGYYSTVMADGPISYWRLGETSGTLLKDELNIRRGDYYNFPTLNQSGALPSDTNPSVMFNGTTQYAEVPFNDLLNTKSFSVEFWAYPNGGSGTYRAVMSSRQYPQGWVLYGTDTNTWTLWINDGSGMPTIGNAQMTLNTWTHFTATFDGTTASLYINGASVGTKTISNYTPNTSAGFIIGQVEGGYYFPGKVDEVSYYNKALTAAQVKAHYTAGIASVVSSPTPTGIINNPTNTPTPTRTPMPTVTPTPIAKKTGDLNGDGQIGLVDLSILLSNWSTTNAVADVNHDGTVGIIDLSMLLSNWGL